MEPTSTNRVSLFQHAFRWGAIVGGVSIAITIVLYVIDYALLADWKMLLLLVLFLGLVIYAGINYRNQAEEFPYGKAFQHAFLVFAVSGIISTIFMILLYTVIDPELPSKLTEVSIENARQMMENFSLPEDKIDEAVEDAKKRSVDQFSAVGLITSFGFGLIFYAVLSLIGAIFTKKSQPAEMV